jgi:hypothetical protein
MGKLNFRRVMGFLMRFATYLLAGPPVGAMLYVGSGLVHAIMHDGSGLSLSNVIATAMGVVVAVWFITPFAIMVSYMVAGLAAFVGGLVVAFLGPLIPYRPIRPAFAGVVGATSAYSLWLPLEPLEWNGGEIAIAGAISAVICSSFVEFAESEISKLR